MTGEILRLRKFKTYEPKKRVPTGLISRDGNAPVGKHIVVAVLGAVPEEMELNDEFIEKRMELLGWQKIPGVE